MQIIQIRNLSVLKDLDHEVLTDHTDHTYHTDIYRSSVRGMYCNVHVSLRKNTHKTQAHTQHTRTRTYTERALAISQVVKIETLQRHGDKARSGGLRSEKALRAAFVRTATQVADITHTPYHPTSHHTTPRHTCLLYTSPSPRDRQKSRMPSSA